MDFLSDWQEKNRSEIENLLTDLRGEGYKRLPPVAARQKLQPSPIAQELAAISEFMDQMQRDIKALRSESTSKPAPSPVEEPAPAPDAPAPGIIQQLSAFRDQTVRLDDKLSKEAAGRRAAESERDRLLAETASLKEELRSAAAEIRALSESRAQAEALRQSQETLFPQLSKIHEEMGGLKALMARVERDRLKLEADNEALRAEWAQAQQRIHKLELEKVETAAAAQQRVQKLEFEKSREIAAAQQRLHALEADNAALKKAAEPPAIVPEAAPRNEAAIEHSPKPDPARWQPPASPGNEFSAMLDFVRKPLP